jgi:hypothetical protein
VKKIEERVAKIEELQDEFDSRLCDIESWIDPDNDKDERDEEVMMKSKVVELENRLDDLVCSLNGLKDKFLDWETWMERSPDDDES